MPIPLYKIIILIYLTYIQEKNFINSNFSLNIKLITVIRHMLIFFLIYVIFLICFDDEAFEYDR